MKPTRIKKDMQKVQKFIDEWKDDALGVKPAFKFFFQDLLKRKETEIEFHERPGITYSLRGIHRNQKDRPLFVLIDVIDDDPKQRWLSVCFYDGTVNDPDEQGDLIPAGILGVDGYCFNVTESDQSFTAYVQQRIQEAYDCACQDI
jgi:hypothetical protein